MVAFLTSEAGLSLVTLAVGWFFRNKTERDKMYFDVLLARDNSMNQAAERTKNGGTWMRRGLYALIAFVFIMVILAPFMGEPVVVENVVQKGMWFWKRTVTEFVTVDGVLFPADIRKAFLMFIAFYLGQGIKAK